ncbi:MAG TPA: HAMP domain-containing sensor histidine kinase [Polyangiaceae bacterium]|jgi:signal transduction histidine kinase
MSAGGLAEAIASGDEGAILAAVAAARGALEGEELAVDRAGLAELLVPLARSPSVEVREAVAGLADRFPAPWFDRAMEAFAGDGDRWVRSAATRAAERRARVRGRRKKAAGLEQAQGEALDEVERAYGKKARRLAERAVRQGREQFVAGLDHELKKVAESFDRALAALGAEIDRPSPSAAVLRAQAGALKSQFAFSRAIVRRAREATARTVGRFADEAIGPLLERAVGTIREHLGERAAGVVFAVEAEEGLRAHVDRDALLQALENVIKNAVEAYGGDLEGAPVQVSARRVMHGGGVEIEVADEGGGMGEEERAAMFVPFGSTKPGGTGVGMLIVRKMVEEVHEGELGIDSAPGEGTSVVFRLPAKQRGVR